MNNKEFLKVHQDLELENLIITLDDVIFDGNHNIINYLKEKNIEYIVIYDIKEHLINHLKKSCFYYIGIIFFLIYFCIFPFSISNIQYSGTKIDKEIKEYLNQYLKKIGPFTFVNKDIKDISRDLSSKYANYEWININKIGTVLFVEAKEPLPNKPIFGDENTKGDLIAKYSGVIKFYNIRQGRMLYTINDYVEKGDILVSGNLESREGNTYVRSDGYIIADLFANETIRIEKNTWKEERTGNAYKLKVIDLWGLKLQFGKKSNYVKYDEVKGEENKHFLNILSYDIVFYEKNDIIISYDKDEAYECALNMIYTNFLLVKKYDVEKINDIILLSKENDQFFYTFNFLVNKRIDIAEFARRDEFE